MALLPMLALAQTPPASYRDLKFAPLREVTIPKVEEMTLPNGMKVYLLESHSLPMVRGTALIRTGNLFDPAGQVGLAGLTGDAIRSGGTIAKTGDQLDEELENIAASVESQIGESFGTVSFSTLKENTDAVLKIFHDVLVTPAFREDKLNLAKAQTRSGISRRNDDARGISQREFTNLVYGKKSPYGWDLEYATIDAIHRADVVKFYQRYYFPANIILAVQGDFSAPEMKAKIAQAFAGWNATQLPVPPFPKVNNQAKPGIYVATKSDVTQTNFALGHLGGLANDKDYPALEVMADILGGGFKSRLFLKVRTQLGYAYEVNADWGANYDHPGLFMIAGSTKSASTVDTLRAIREEVYRIRTELVTEQELETAKQTVVNSFVFEFDTPSKTLNRLLTYRYFGYPDDFVFAYQKAIVAVTREDILRVAKQYVDPAKFVMVATGNPKDFGKPLSALGMPVSDIDLTIPEPPARRPATKQVGKPLDWAATPGARVAVAKDAMGGKKLDEVKDYAVTGTVQLDASAGGLKVTQNTQWLAPGHYRQENVLPFAKIVTYSDGKSGWSATPQGVVAIPEAQLKQITFESFRLWFSLLKGDDKKLADAGENAVQITDQDGHSLTLNVSGDTGLPASTVYESPGNPNGPVTEVYSDWQETGGVKLPRKIVLKQGGKHFADVTVTSITLNQGLTREQISKKP